MFNPSRSQIAIIVIILLSMLFKIKEKYSEDCGVIDKPDSTCNSLSIEDCENYAKSKNANFVGKNDVFCGIVGECPIGCYFYDNKYYFGSPDNKGNCSLKRKCITESKN